MKCPNCGLLLKRQDLPNDFLWLCEEDGTVVDERYCDFPEPEEAETE